MKLSSVFLAALAPIAAFALPSPVEEAAAAATQPSSPEPKFDTGSNTIEKRASRAVVVADGLRYRTCPRTSCTAVGQYARGTEVTLRCYTREGTTVVNGDAYGLLQKIMLLSMLTTGQRLGQARQRILGCLVQWRLCLLVQ